MTTQHDDRRARHYLDIPAGWSPACPDAPDAASLDREIDFQDRMTDSLFDFLSCPRRMLTAVLIALLLMLMGYGASLVQQASWDSGDGQRAAAAWQKHTEAGRL